MRTLLLLLLIVTAPCFLLASPTEPTIEERMVPIGHGISGEEIYVNSLKISPDYKHIAYVSRIGGTFRVWMDGVTKKSHSGITRQSPFFSPKQNRVAYIADENDKMFVVVDNEEHDRYKQVGTLTFSPDGSRLAYRAEDDKGRQVVVIDGKEGPKFDVGITNDIGIVFSPDSKHVAYVGLTGNNSCIFVKDNKKMRSFEKIGRIEFSPDSKHYAYTAMEDGTWKVILDDKEGTEYKQISNLMFSPDSSHTVYMASSKKRRPIIVKNDVEISGGIGVFFPAFSPKRNRFCYLMAEKDNKFRYVIDGKQDQPVDKPGRIIFSHDDSSSAYAAMIDDKWHIIKDGKKGPGFKKIYAFSYSPVNNDILYAAENEAEQTCVVVNDSPGNFYDSIGVPAFSPDGKTYAYVASHNDKKMFMVINGVEQQAYPIIGIPMEEAEGSGIGAQRAFFSEAGNRLAYPVYDPDKKTAFMVVDGKPQAIFDAVMLPCFSTDEKHIAYMGKKNDAWHLVVDGKAGSNTCDGMIRGATIAFDPARNCFFILVASKGDSGLSFYRMEAEIK